MAVSKVFIVCFSIVMLGLGLIIMVEGIRILMDNPLYDITELRGFGFTVSGTFIVSLLLGVSLVVLSIIGLAHFFMPRTIFLVLYMTIVTVLFLVALAFTIYVVWAAVTKQLDARMTSGVKQLIKTRKTVPTDGELLDLIQKQLKCCGAEGASDYSGDAPSSCGSNQDGCGNALAKLIRKHLYIFIVLNLLVLLILGALVGLGVRMLWKHFRK